MIKKFGTVFFTWFFLHAQAWAMCSLCRESLKQSGKEGLITGFYWSIVLLVSIPLCVLVWAIRQGARRY